MLGDYLTQAFIVLFVLDAILVVSLWFILNQNTKITKGKITGIVAVVGFLPFCSIFAWALFPIIGLYSLFLLVIPVLMYFMGPAYWRTIEVYQEILKKADEKGKPFREKLQKDKFTRKR